MRILLTTDSVGGVWDHTVALAGGLHRAGCEVLVAGIGEPRHADRGRLPEGVQVVWRAYRLEWMTDAEADVAAAGAWLRELAVLWGAELVHLNQLTYSAEPFPVPVVVAVHSDVASWWRIVNGEEPPATLDPYVAAVRAGLRGADALVTPTAWQAEQVLAGYGVRVDRVVPNGVDLPAGEPFPGEDGLVLSVGRLWDRGKGADVLDAALAAMDDPPATHFLGDVEGPDGTGFLPGHGIAHGRLDRAGVDGWMRRASIYVAPSRYEPFGLAPLEAALHGCALVLSDIPTFRQLWGGCADFFPSGDAEGLARVLRRTLDDPAHRARRAAAARDRALRRYSTERMAAGYLKLYRGVLAGGLAPMAA
jgi:glycogen synthase